MNGADIAQPRGALAQSYFYEQPRRDDDGPPPVPGPPQQPPNAQQPPFTAGYDAHPQDQPQPNADNSAEDSDDQLSVQTLNADGTPKRPMNAFLLYAKKRRPQISTNHPTMRTGEISKVLSKEWQGMPKGEKQYYQDKAKKLKDSFNLRWPDYVYKRRPNNSRKKRRGIPNTDSPVVEDVARRDSEGADNDGYGDNSGGDDAEGSPNLVVRLPHERHGGGPDDGRGGGMGLAQQPYPPQGPPSAGPPPMGSRMPYPPNPAQQGAYPGPPSAGYGGEDAYTGYPYYTNNGSGGPPPQNRLPPVWASNPHDASRSPYDGPRSASTGYSPVGGEGGDAAQQQGGPWGQQAQAVAAAQAAAGQRPGGGPSPITTSWQTPLHPGSGGPLSSRPGGVGGPGQRTSADNSPVQSSSDLAFRGGNRPPPTPQSAGGARGFQTLNAPMYPPSGAGGPGSAGPGGRGGSPTSAYASGGYSYGGPGGPGGSAGPGGPAGASNGSNGNSNMRADSGGYISPMLPPIGGGPPRDASRASEGDRAPGDRRDASAPGSAPGNGHQAYWDPVKAEAGE